MSYIQPTLTQDQITTIANYINTYRAKHQAPAITWDPSIAKFSQQWTYYMSYHNIFQHSGTASYGENISYLQGYGTDIVTLIKKSIDSWYNENTLYDYNNPGFSKETGHFTCLVWKSSTSFGIGITLNNSTNEAYISMNTFPPGNYSGQFIQNVLRPIANSLPVVPPVPAPTPPVTPVTPVPSPTPSVPPVEPPILPGVPTPILPIKIVSTRPHLNNELYKIMRANNLNYSKASILNSLNTIVNTITNDPNF
jgi:hypothetical protein